MIKSFTILVGINSCLSFYISFLKPLKKSNLMKNLFKTSIFANLLTIVMQIVFLYFISRYIAHDIYGQYALVLTLFSFVSLIFIAPLSNASQRFIHEYDTKTFYGLFNTLQLVSLSIAIVVFFIVAYFTLNDSFSIDLLLVASLYILSSSLSSFYKSLDLQKLKNKSYLLGTFLDGLSRFIMPIVLYYIYESLLAMLFGLAVGYLLSFVLIYLRHEAKYEAFEFLSDKAKFRAILLYAFPFILTSIGSWSISFSDRWFINYYLDASKVGEYAILAQFGGILMIFGSIITTYLMPAVFNKAKESHHIAYSEFKKVFIYVIIFIFVGTIILLSLPMYFLEFVMGSIVSKGNNYFVFLGIYFGIIFLILSNVLSTMYMMYKRTNEMIYFWTFAAAVNLCGNFFIQHYGILAAAISTMLAYTIVFTTSYFRLKVIVNNENN
jgi:O-antigen/teichoic acid export membrane protein